METCFSNRSYAWTDLKSIWLEMCAKFPRFMEWTKWTKMNIILESPELSWNRLESIAIETWSVPGNFGGSSIFRNGSGQCFHFGFREVEIMETFETNLETWKS